MTRTRAPEGDDAQRLLRTLWRLDHVIGKQSKRMETTIGLTFQQRTVLRFVGRFPGVTSGALSEALHVDPGTVSATLGRLEARGLLERRRDPRDGRRILLGLTDRGRALDVPGGPTIEAAVARAVRGVGREALETTEQMLTRLAEEIEALDVVEPTAVPKRARRSTRT